MKKNAGVVRLTVDLGFKEAKALGRIAELNNSSMTGAIKSALATELAVLNERELGAKVLLRAPDGSTSELLFTR